MNRFQKLALVSAAATLAQVAAGALVRATGSGLACPDWPKCFDSWIPPMRAGTLMEYTHRLIGSVVGVLVLALAINAWLHYRSRRTIFWPAFAALLVVAVQGAIGGAVVLGDLPRNLVALHFFMSVTLLGLLSFTATASITPSGGRMNPLAKLGVAGAAVTFALMMIGAFVSQYDAALVYGDWPLMNGRLVPSGGQLGLLHYVHRATALIVGLVLAAMAYRATKAAPADKWIVKFAHAAFGLWALQVVVGGLNVLTGSSAAAVVAHVVLAELLWATIISFCLLAYRQAGGSRQSASAAAGEDAVGPPALEKVKAYFLLTKPRIIELLLITTVPAMILAERGWPPASLILATLLGGTLAAGSANAINCYLDRDIDEKMERTSGRPLPRHAVVPRNALVFGIILGIAGFLFLALVVNVVAAALGAGAILFYVFIYTILMKRSTPSNIVIGGAAGAVPVLVGWAAVTGTVNRGAWVMFAIVFFWTPPHFWALALRYSDQYKAAGVPMLPVVRGVAETTRQILLYTVVLFSVSLLLYPVASLGVVYLASTLILGAAFVIYSLRLWQNPGEKRAMGLFHFSISHLVLLFVSVAVDQLVGAPRLPGLYEPALVVAGVLFVIFEGAILVSVMRGPSSERPASLPRGGRLAAEVLWTVIPLLVMAGLFLAAWQARGLASP